MLSVRMFGSKCFKVGGRFPGCRDGGTNLSASVAITQQRRRIKSSVGSKAVLAAVLKPFRLIIADRLMEPGGKF